MVSVLAILIALFVINIVSLFMPLFNKNNHDFVSFMTRLNVKDTKEFEGPVDATETTDAEESNNDGSEQQNWSRL